MTERPMRSGERLHALDAFRGAAALWVVVYHVTLRYPHFMLGQNTPLTPLFPGFTERDAGIVPVLWFFLISGFVITWTVARCATPMDFVISRVSRIYPAYWASLVLTVAAVALFPLPGVAPSLRDILVNATMFQTYVFVPHVAGVYWSLCIEIMFYVFALALFAAGLWRFVHVAAFAWAVLALGVTVWTGLGHWFPWRVTVFLLTGFAPYLVAGMMLYQLWRGNRVGWSVATLAVCVVAIFASAPVVSAVMVVAAMGLIAWSCRGGLQWLAAPPLVWLGSVSYSLYLVHEYPAYITMRAGDAAGLPHWISQAAAVGVALGLAAAVSYGVERPAMRAIRDLWRGRVFRPAPGAGADAAPPAGPAAPGSPG